MESDLETRRAEFYHEWITQKANLSSLRFFAMFLGQVESRLYLKEWKQALLLFLLCYILIGLLIANIHEAFVLIIFPVYFYEWVTSKGRVRKFNQAFEKQLIAKWGEDAISK